MTRPARWVSISNPGHCSRDTSTPRHSRPESVRCVDAGLVQNKLMCYPQQLRRSWKDFGHLARNLLEPHQPSAREPSGPQLSAPEPSGTSSAICTGTLRNLISHLHRNPPEPHQPSAAEPSGTSSAICTGTLRNFISHLRRSPPEPH